jgi:hypothetical protein
MPSFRRGPRDNGGTEDGAMTATDAELPQLNPFQGIPDKRYELKAEDLLRPFKEPDAPGLLRWRKPGTNAPIVPVEDKYITGVLDLRAADLDYLFRFERCRFEHPPDVREAKILGMVFRRCWLPGLKARNLRSRNDLRLIRSVVEVEPEARGNQETTVRRAETRERGMPDAAVNLTDAVVEGSIVLTRTRLLHPRGKALQADRLLVTGAFLAYRLEADGETRVPGMRAGGNVNFSGATLNNPDGFALNGNGLQVGGSLLCEVDTYGQASERKKFRANGILYLPSAHVDSDVVLRGAKLEMNQQGPIVMDAWKSRDPYLDPRPSLVADRIRVDGNMELSDGLEATGTLRMINAKIGGSLRLARAQITVPRGQGFPFYDRALHLDGSEIDGDIEATGLTVPSGQLRLADVTVRGNLLASHATFLHHNRDVLSARRTKISGNLQLSDSTIEGTARLQGVEVGGSIYCYGAQVTKPSVRGHTSFSVDVRTARIGRDLAMTANRDRAFVAEGGVNLDGATVARRLDLEGAKLSSLSDHVPALDVSDVVADEFALTPGERPAGRVVLRRAHCGTLSDNAELWGASGGLELEDFRYDILKRPIDVKDDAAVEDRIRLLHNAMDGYRPGPYDQLAAMLRTSGNEEHALTVLFMKQQYRYEALASGYRALAPLMRLWSWLQRWMVGYGYRPIRALGWLAVLLVLGSVWFGVRSDPCVGVPGTYAVHDTRCAIDQQDTGLQWNPVLYTADLLVPIVDFGNKARWYMSGVDQWVSAGFTAMGWVLATTVAASAGRMIRRDS